MNEHISQYLFQYLENPDPQYAVMLKGKWGCGKSYFIQEWIKQYKKKQKDGRFKEYCGIVIWFLEKKMKKLV